MRRARDHYSAINSASSRSSSSVSVPGAGITGTSLGATGGGGGFNRSVPDILQYVCRARCTVTDLLASIF